MKKMWRTTRKQRLDPDLVWNVRSSCILRNLIDPVHLSVLVQLTEKVDSGGFFFCAFP